MSSHDQHDEREHRLDEAAAQYLRLRASGKKIDRQAWLAQYADLADELAGFLDDLEHLTPVADHTQTSVFAAPLGLDATLESGPPSPTSATKPVEVGRANPPRYHLRDFLAAGGMGEVWRAEDTQVGRLIAVKRIRHARQANSAIEARFLFEAQIMGQLEHPCIVPLHDLGRNEAGELFSVMKLVHGSSLKQRLVAFHTSKSADWPRHVEFRRLLEAFVSICQAVAYAHSRGVLHRDIKPDNVMLGDFGEAMLLDWGLAKAMDKPDGAADNSATSGRVRSTSGNSTATQAGAVMGSPAYMAPEVAAGQSEAVDQRTDVYLLGATLYEVLTARPPRSGISALELIELAQRAPPPPPRSVDRRVPRPLEAICQRAMALEREDRYASASALAQEVENYLADEPVLAYREPLAVRTWRWCKRHRRPLARACLALIFLAVGSIAYISFRHAQDLESREAARRQLAEFRRLADEAQFFAANSDALTEQAPYYDPQRAMNFGEQALARASAWGDDGAKLPLVGERTALKSELHDLQLIVANLHQRLEVADSQTTALALLERAERLQAPSRASQLIRLRCLRQLGRAAETKQEAELGMSPPAGLTAIDWFLEGEFQRTNAAEQRDPWLPSGSSDSAAIEQAIYAYQQALRIDPRHYWAQFQLARCYLRMQRGPEAVEALGTCIALRPEAPWAYSTRGLVRGMLGEFASAEADLNEALRLAPNFRPARLNRGFVWSLQGRDEEALAEFDATLQPPAEAALTEAAFYRAQVHAERSDFVTALRDCEHFLTQRPSFRPALVLAAQLHFRQGDDSAAMRRVEELLASGSQPTHAPTSTEARLARGRVLRELAVGLDMAAQQRVLRLAWQDLEAAHSPEADSDITAIKDLLGATEEAIDRYSQRLSAAPHDVDTRVLRGWCYAKLQRYELAAADFQAAIEQAPDDAEAHSGWGYVQALSGNPADAELAAMQALLLGANDYLVLSSVACIYGELADARPARAAEYEDLALTLLERAVTLARQHPAGFDEREFLRTEPAFHSSLRARPEFQRLLGERP